MREGEPLKLEAGYVQEEMSVLMMLIHVDEAMGRKRVMQQ